MKCRIPLPAFAVSTWGKDHPNAREQRGASLKVKKSPGPITTDAKCERTRRREKKPRPFQERFDMKKQALKFVGLLSIALAVVCFAPQRAAADEDDPPGRVARLSYTHGAVSFNPAGTEDWVNAVVNRPITTGDKLWTDDRARAELHIGSAVIRLSDHTGFSFLNLTDNVSQIRVTEVTLNVLVRRSRPPRRPLGFLALRLARRDRLRRPGRLWRLAPRAGARPRLVPAHDGR